MSDTKMIESPSMFVLTADLQRLYDFGFTEDDAEAFNDTLEVIKEGIADKADGYCAVINRLDANVQLLKAEKERLDNMQQTIENNIFRMKEALKYVLETMEANGEKPEIITPLHKIKFHGNGGKQPMDIIEEKVPDNFKRIVYETDKEKIRVALEKGEKLDFAELKPRGRYVDGIMTKKKKEV